MTGLRAVTTLHCITTYYIALCTNRKCIHTCIGDDSDGGDVLFVLVVKGFGRYSYEVFVVVSVVSFFFSHRQPTEGGGRS